MAQAEDSRVHPVSAAHLAAGGAWLRAMGIRVRVLDRLHGAESRHERVISNHHDDSVQYREPAGTGAGGMDGPTTPRPQPPVPVRLDGLVHHNGHISHDVYSQL